jgi:hypothetical protein
LQFETEIILFILQNASKFAIDDKSTKKPEEYADYKKRFQNPTWASILAIIRRWISSPIFNYKILGYSGTEGKA